MHGLDCRSSLAVARPPPSLESGTNLPDFGARASHGIFVPGEKDEQRVLDPERWLADHGDYLYHFALNRVRDTAVAEDLVQESLLAALRAAGRYAGRSSERTWLAGILKNKVLDYYRRAGRETSFTDLEFYSEDEDRTFDNPSFPDHWNGPWAPQPWPEPGAALDSEAFWKVFRLCVAKVPERAARVFLLREVDGVPSDEICRTLDITPNNLWVMLHRTRMALRRCLEENWFCERRQPGAAP